MGMITVDNGIRTYELTSKIGGHIVIGDFGAENVIDIGMVSIRNAHGLGVSEWIRSVEEIENHISTIKQTWWLTPSEREECIDFLHSIKS